MAFDHNTDIKRQQFSAMAPKVFRMKYIPEIIIYTLENNATSRSWYNRLIVGFHLATLPRLT